MPQVKRLPEDPKLFEQLLLTRAVAVIVGQPESVQLPSRESVQSLLTDDEIETAIENAACCAGEFVRRVKEDGPMLSDASGYDQGSRYSSNCRESVAGTVLWWPDTTATLP